jgi:transcriptional regulator GlxA family with amidase domain
MDAEIVIFDGSEDLDAFGPLAVLAMAGYQVALVTVGEPGPTVSDHGTVVVPARRISEAPDLVVVPGGGWLDRAEKGAWAEAQKGDLPDALAKASSAGSLLTSVCTGAFLIAATGLLRGRPAVTNAAALDELAATGVHVVRDARVVDDGDIITSGGLTAGLDLALWLIERHQGAARAREIGRQLEYGRRGQIRRRIPAAAPAASASTEVAGLAVPHTALAAAAHEVATELPAAILNHSVRSYLFARLVAQSRALEPGVDFDDELLYVACVLHDTGLAASADSGARFEVDGADLAEQLLSAHGVPTDRATIVWDAIALHTSSGIAERKQAETQLARAGIALDFGAGAEIVPDDTARAIHQAWPRLDMARCLADAIVAQAAGRPNKAPSGTFPGQVVHERSQPPYVTGIEQRERDGRWGS